MTYQQTLDYMFDKLPMYQRIGGAAYKADLKNTLELCHLLGNPEKGFPSVHVAGTNGKGSTSHMMASVLQESGYKTGLYTSPHLKDFRERIRINGRMIDHQAVIDFISEWKDQFEHIGLSFFEMTVGMAFDYFVKEKVDIAVIEVGMGGRLDSTNVITPLVSVITNIGLDHTKFLGDTLSAIATEKAGIIKPAVPVVIGETHPDTREVFQTRAEALQSPITFADQKWNIVRRAGGELAAHHDSGLSITGIGLPLKGDYQMRNLTTVMEGVRVLNEYTSMKISATDLKRGLSGVLQNTGLQGRWQTICERPLTICDCGHNEDGIRQVLINIRQTPHKKLHFVFGMVNDKIRDAILQMLPKNAVYYFCKPDIPRGLDAEILAGDARRFGLTGEVYATVQLALEAAKYAAGDDDLIFVGGSIFVVAEVV